MSAFRGHFEVIALAGLGVVPALAYAGTQENLDLETGSFFESIWYSGPSTNRVDITFIGDGYTNSEREQFKADARSFADAILNPTYDPFLKKYNNFFNIQMVGYDSETSTRSFTTASEFASAKTALGTTMFGPKYDADDGNTGKSWKDFPKSAESRLFAAQNVYFGTNLGTPYYKSELIKNSEGVSLYTYMGSGSIRPETTVIMINSGVYGGLTNSNGLVLASSAGSSAKEVFLHEYAHALAGLGDEYTNSDQLHPTNKVNIITSDAKPTDAQIKWSYWIEYQKENGIDYSGEIGVFEGAAGKPTGYWRPSADSKMKTLNRPFDAVSREAFILAIYGKVRPIDSYTLGTVEGSQLANYLNFQVGDDKNGGAIDLALGQTLSVQVIDPDVITIEWYADGILISGASDGTLNPYVHGFAAGEQHIFWAKCFDKAEDENGYKWVLQDPGDLLSQSVYWTVTLIPEPSSYAICFATLGLGWALVRRRRH
ncbi:MAG: M64 family metallopeptidase [Puniceicoccales bacterium]|nr:M64 family metallopeptidase [Puniceicoccales bacterium]